MSLKTQISLGFVFVLLLTLISLSTLFFYFNKIGSTATTLLEQDYRTVKASEALVNSLMKMDQILAKVCLSNSYNETVLLQVLDREKKLFRSNLDILGKNLSERYEQEGLVTINAEYERYSRHIHQVHTAPDRNILYFSVLQRQHELMLNQCISLAFTNHEAIKEKDKNAQSLYFRAKVNTFLVTVLVLLLVAGTIYQMPGEIVRPITEMSSAVKNMVRGEFSQRVEVQTSELAELARSFNLAGEKLQETEEKFWLITSNLYDIVLFAKPDASVFYTTPSVTRLLGHQPEEVLGKDIYYLLHPNDKEKIKTVLTSIIECSFTYHEPLELRLRKKDGQYLWVEASYIAQTDAAHQPLYIQGTFRDITERITAEQKMKKALRKEKQLNEQLTKAQAELDQFVYSTSHNLRGPLASILGVINLLKKTNTRKERSTMLEFIEKSIGKLDETIHEITDYARNNRLAVHSEPIDFTSMIQDTVERLQYLPAACKVDIQYNIREGIDFYSDAYRLQVIFNNLISNAIKYYDPEQPRSYLNIIITSSGNNAVIAIEDNGIGILTEHQDRIFDMFHRATELSTGSGLGLYIVKEIINKLKGSIKVTSACGESTTFTLTIPNLKAKTEKVEKAFV